MRLEGVEVPGCGVGDAAGVADGSGTVAVTSGGAGVGLGWQAARRRKAKAIRKGHNRTGAFKRATLVLSQRLVPGQVRYLLREVPYLLREVLYLLREVLLEIAATILPQEGLRRPAPKPAHKRQGKPGRFRRYW